MIARISLLAGLIAFARLSPAHAAKMAMGFRVGEVTQNSAVVWTRVTENQTGNFKGVMPPKKREPKSAEYVPSKMDVDSRRGATPGAPGEVQCVYWRNDVKGAQREFTKWVRVKAANDFVHQFKLTGLDDGANYSINVNARDIGEERPSSVVEGEFGTPSRAEVPQNVTFTVVTGQSYWDLDDPRGYHIYPAMAKLFPDFIVPTGDTVYLDSESPRARTVELARHHWHRMYSLPRLVNFHRTVPGYWEVDDHDTWCNDCWPTLKAKWMNPLTFEQGKKVYLEQVPMDGDKTHRTVRWGKHLQVWMVEGRFFRSPNNMPDGPDKLIWGKKQREWLKRTLLESDASFKVLVSPTPIVGPDRPKGKNDNHSNDAFATAGNHFRDWTKEHKLNNLFVCCGDRHWQYLSVDPKTHLHEFSCGPASDKHAGGSPGRDKEMQPFHRQKGGFLSVSVTQPQGVPTIVFRFHDVHGKPVYEFTSKR